MDRLIRTGTHHPTGAVTPPPLECTIPPCPHRLPHANFALDLVPIHKWHLLAPGPPPVDQSTFGGQAGVLAACRSPA